MDGDLLEVSQRETENLLTEQLSLEVEDHPVVHNKNVWERGYMIIDMDQGSGLNIRSKNQELMLVGYLGLVSITVSYHSTILSSFHLVILSSCHLVILSSCHRIILSPGFLGAKT